MARVLKMIFPTSLKVNFSLQERIWSGKLCAQQFGGIDETKRAEEIVGSFLENEYEFDSSWSEKFDSFTSKATLPQNYQRVAQLWCQMLFNHSQCKYLSSAKPEQNTHFLLITQHQIRKQRDRVTKKENFLLLICIYVSYIA